MACREWPRVITAGLISRARVRSLATGGRLLQFGRTQWARALVEVLRHAYVNQSIPLRSVLLARRLTFGPDSLCPGVTPERGVITSDPVIRSLFADAEIGVWTLGSSTLAFLERRIAANRPRCILEFGSGVSTVLIAHAMSHVHDKPGRVLLVSLEQDSAQAERTRALLVAAGLSEVVRVLHTPLVVRSNRGEMRSAYDITTELLRELEAFSFDLVVIDGPSAEAGARVTTLDGIRALLRPGAEVYMDDALRDGEICAAKYWASDGWLDVRGVWLVDKGILETWVIDATSHRQANDAPFVSRALDAASSSRNGAQIDPETDGRHDVLGTAIVGWEPWVRLSVGFQPWH